MVIKQLKTGELIVGTGKKWIGPFSCYGEAQLYCECEGAAVIKNGGVMQVTPEDIESPVAAPATAKSAKGKSK